MEKRYTRSINSQTELLSRLNEDVAGLSTQAAVFDEGVQSLAKRVDEDLVALDERVDRRRLECDRVEDELVLAQGRISVLEERVRSQRSAMERMSARLDKMEGQLCHCGKGKERAVLEDVSPVLGSPIVLGTDLDTGESSDESFKSSSAIDSSTMVPSSSSSTKENELVLYDSASSRLVEIVEDPMENSDPIPVPAPRLDVEGIDRLFAVRGQRAIRSSGPPKSSFHPYRRCCALEPRSSTHGIGYPCSGLPFDGGSSSSEGGVETSGWTN